MSAKQQNNKTAGTPFGDSVISVMVTSPKLVTVTVPAASGDQGSTLLGTGGQRGLECDGIMDSPQETPDSDVMSHCLRHSHRLLLAFQSDVEPRKEMLLPWRKASVERI